MAIMSGTLVIGLLLNELTFNIAVLRLGGIHILSVPVRLYTQGDRTHLSIPYASMATPCKTFSHTLGFSWAESGGRWVGSRGRGVEGIGVGGEDCSSGAKPLNMRGRNIHGSDFLVRSKQAQLRNEVQRVIRMP